MKIQQFDGGLSSRLAPQFLSQNQGVEYENIDNALGTLTPVNQSLATAIDVERYNTYYIKGAEWVSSAEPATFLEYQNVLYTATGDGRPLKYSNGEENFLGISEPSTVSGAAGTAFEKPPLDTFDVQNNLLLGDLSRGRIAYRLYTRPVGSTLYSAPLEFVVSATSVAAPGTTNIDSVNIVDQVTVNDKGVSIGVNSGSIFADFINTQDGPRAINIGNIVGLDSADYEEARLYRYYEGKWYFLQTFTNDSTVYTDAVYDISGEDELDAAIVSPFNGTYQYVYTYYNSADGTESAPSAISDALELVGGEVQVFVGASSDPQTDNIRIYRVGGYRTLFAMVAEIPNANATYIDKLTDSDMDGRLLESENYYAAPEGLNFLSESYAMLFGAVDYTLYFTPIGVPNAWPPEYSIQFNAPITGIGPVANGVLVMTETQTFIVTGTGPLSLSMQTLRGDQGCASHYSIQEVQEGSLVWASKDGLCSSSGSNVVNITKAALGEIKLDIVNSAVVDEVYYLHLTSGKTLVWDYRFTPIFKYLDLGLESVTAASSTIYGWSAGVLYELFKAASPTTLKYLSPRFVEGSLTEAKTYKKVYVSHDGDIIINIIIDDELVTTKALTGKEAAVIQVPSAKQRGRYIQFELTGTGSVDEIKYEASRQKDG